jgi:hypothetical protein
VTISEKDFLTVIKNCLNGELAFEDIERWADAIESREDLNFENEDMQEIIFELANPEINGKINRARLNTIIEQFDHR